MIANEYTELSLTLYPCARGFSPRSQELADDLTHQIAAALARCHLRAVFRVPPPGEPWDRIDLRAEPVAARTVSHARAASARAAFLDLPWISEVEALGICRL